MVFRCYRYFAYLDAGRNHARWRKSWSKPEHSVSPSLLNLRMNSYINSCPRNMYLAEDRILCFEIVTKQNANWVLKYVKSAKAVTDVPTTVPEFISQRRRWLNGSFFASLHATLNFYKIWTSGHSFLRKLALQLEFIYNAIQMLFAWTSLANFYLSFFFLSECLLGSSRLSADMCIRCSRVQSATKPGPNDAFNFLANGAGTRVFEIILKVRCVTLKCCDCGRLTLRT